MKVNLKHLNLALLVFSFGLGQGAIFLANSYLYWSKQFSVVASFGTASAFSSLLYFVVDWGGGNYLAKEVVAGKEQRHPHSTFLALSCARLAVAVICVAACFLFFKPGDSGLYAQYMRYASLGTLFYAFNAAGLLDGYSKSGFSGIYQIIPNLAVAVALPVAATLQPSRGGMILGGVYSVGTALSVVLQLLHVGMEWRTSCQHLSVKGSLREAREAFYYLLSPLPGLIFFRTQIALANAFLPTIVIANFLYVRQLIGVGYQAVGFYLRVDLADFAARFAVGSHSVIAVVARSATVRLSLAIAFVFVAIACAAYPLRSAFSVALLLYCPCLLSAAFAVTTTRYFLVRSAAGIVVAAQTAACAAGLLYAFAMIRSQGVPALIGAEMICHVVALLVLFNAPRVREQNGGNGSVELTSSELLAPSSPPLS